MNSQNNQSATDAGSRPEGVAPEPPARKPGRSYGLLPFVVGSFLVFALVSVTLPYFNTVTAREGMTKELAYAKQIGLALKLYAGDHDGAYPAGTNNYGEPIRTSNDAFRCLFPTYTQAETIFGNKRSAWQKSVPDNIITPINEALKPGENVYAYVEGLTDASNPGWPLIADGTDGTGHYAIKLSARGGAWAGARAIVIRVDNSGALETLTGPENARYVSGHLLPSSLEPHNILDVASYMGPQVRLLDPALFKP